MKTCLAMIVLAATALGTAKADIPPPPPDNPVPEACKPLIGIWSRTTPHDFGRDKSWTVIAIDSSGATLLNFNNAEDIDITAKATRYKLDCTPDDGGKLKLSLAPESSDDDTVTMDITRQGDATFTMQEKTSYTGRGHDPNWKPQMQTVTFKRIAP